MIVTCAKIKIRRMIMSLKLLIGQYRRNKIDDSNVAPPFVIRKPEITEEFLQNEYGEAIQKITVKAIRPVAPVYKNLDDSEGLNQQKVGE